jgi:hypothetical protein
VYEAGAFEVVFEQDPMRRADAIRFPRLKRWTQPWRSVLQWIPAWCTVIGTTAFAIGIVWGSYYPEIMVLYGASFVIALIGLLRLRRIDMQVGLRGWLLLGIGLCLAGGTAVLSRVPSFRRALAVNHSTARGAQLAFSNGRVRRLLGREIYRPELSDVHGPLEAFPRQVVQDLFRGRVVRGAIDVTSYPGDDKDYSEYAEAVGPHLSEFQLNRLNATTLEQITRNPRLPLSVIQITGKIAPKDVAFLTRRNILVDTLVLIDADAESIQMLKRLADDGIALRRIVLLNCEWDVPAAEELQRLQAGLVIRKTGIADIHRLTLEELDALVSEGCNVEAIHTPTIDGEQAERLAKIPSLTTLSATLLDDRAVEALKSSNLSEVQVKELTESVAESLLSYPALNFVFADTMRIDGSWASRISKLGTPIGPQGRSLYIRTKLLDTDQEGFLLFQRYTPAMRYDAVQYRNDDRVGRQP